MSRVRINAWPSDPLTGPGTGKHFIGLCIRRSEGCPGIQRMHEQKTHGTKKGGKVTPYIVLVIASAMTAPAPVRPVGPAPPVIASAAAAAVITAATIIPATAV